MSESPPRLPSAPGEAVGSIPVHRPLAEQQPRRPHWMQRWDTDQPPARGLMGVANGLLRSQGAVARDLYEGRGLTGCIAGCALLTVVACALYGGILGSIEGPAQVVPAGVKFPAVILGACALCLPSFFVFQALMGARVTLSQALAAVMMLGAAAGLILMACAPIVWFFSVSTEGDGGVFLGVLHAAVIGLAALFGFHFLTRAHRYTVWRYGERLFDGRVLALWFVLLVLVASQLASFVGPLDGSREMFEVRRGFFLSALFE